MKYASVIVRKQSPRYSVAYWCPVRQARVFETTPFLLSDPNGRRKALAMANEKSKHATAGKETGDSERWESWVEAFLNDRYRGRALTLPRYIYAWSQWHSFLCEQRLRVPRALDYNVVLKFIAWRSSQVKPSSGKKVSKNTALCDVKVMSIVMRRLCAAVLLKRTTARSSGFKKTPHDRSPK